MIALVALSWAVVVLAAGWRRRPLGWAARPELELLTSDAPAGPGLLSRWGAGVQRRVPLLGELSSVVVGTAVALGGVLLVVDPPLALILAASVGVAAATRVVTRQRARTAALVAQAPGAIDLLQLCLRSGMTPRLALARVHQLLDDPLRDELSVVVARTGRGEAFAAALAAVSVRGHPLRSVALAMASAETSGQELGPLLERQARDARLALRRQAEERARRLPVVMLLPLVTCVLPAFCLVVVVPMIAGRAAHLL